jgi:hypothetical protein
MLLVHSHQQFRVMVDLPLQLMVNHIVITDMVVTISFLQPLIQLLDFQWYKIKNKIMKKEKTYFDGILVGFAITVVIYSILLGIVIRILTQQ